MMVGLIENMIRTRAIIHGRHRDALIFTGGHPLVDPLKIRAAPHQLHERFGQKGEPGLSNLIVGNAKASEAVRKTPASGLWLLPAGRVPPNPAELLGSQRFKDFLSTLADHFDWIVIDTPPVLPVADASVVAHAVNGVLFVVGAEMTSRHAAGAALDQLSGAKGRVVGAVLNRVDLQHHAYYYSQYYRREYSRYYVKSS